MERHKSVYSNGSFNKVSLSSSEKELYKKRWGRISNNIPLDSVIIGKSLSGTFNVDIVPEELYAYLIEKELNTYSCITFLETKSIYNKWFDKGIFPLDYFHCIDSVFYDINLNVITDINDFVSSLNINFPVVFKPSIDSYGGANVYFLNTKVELMDLIYQFENFVVQEKIRQHDEINLINKGSINTIRVCLFRSKESKTLNVINCSIRMGKGGSLDNETAGGIVCSIDETGVLNDYAVDKYAIKYLEHPDSKFVFKGKLIPLYHELIEKSIQIGEKILYANIMSLDMCLDSEGNWRCIEVNLSGQTIRFAQYAGKPFFGRFTDEILKTLSK
ncbi:hypothetical protein HX025_11580 [Myroides odoratimimus]|uniref:sugar-transfer associated ATP-grasp domain-containing protein n=1 Tax=Myroides odoratimimus TaxID=76832 RepID=UPI002577F2BF|nr:sugar-transfer associated ATP-grasp domain-containing protein [Myroides odoratimimus]MDM1457284.1 hypothetical protein [Myroides odoratimimus]